MTPNEHPNVVAYRRMIAGFNQNDLDAVRAMVVDDFEYTVPGRSPIACHTLDVVSHIDRLRFARERSENTLRLEPKAVAADGDYLLVWSRIRAERQGRILDSDHCTMYRFSEGKIVEGRTIPVDQYSFDEFWC